MADSTLGTLPGFQGRVSELDGLRGLAILFVVVWHYVACLFTPPPGTLAYQLVIPLRIAWSGVDLFFVLSGFLIGGILLDARTSPRFFTTFYMRRFHRIFPLYYAWLAIFYVVQATPIGKHDLQSLFNHDFPAWCYPLYLQNFFMSIRQRFGAGWLGVTWSLAVEEQFYLLLPLAVRFLKTGTLVKFVIAAILTAPVIRLALFASGNEYFGPYTLLPCRADALGCGVLCAIFLRRPAVWAWVAANRRNIYHAMAALSCCVAFLWWHSLGRIMYSVGFTWLALFYCSWLVVSIVRPDPVVRFILNGRFLQQLGTLAYGVYIFHQPVNDLLHALILHAPPVVHDPSTLGVTALAAAATFLLAKLSWRYFEKPLIKRGQARYAY